MENDLERHPFGQRLISREELAWFLGVKSRWVSHKMRTEPGFPVRHAGRYPRFWLRDVLDYLEEQDANSHCGGGASTNITGQPNSGKHHKVGVMRHGK